MDRDYYCNKKFSYIKIDAESNVTYCCHAAKPHVIDKSWLANNPGQLFNTPLLLKERTMMLNNERNSSCEQNCWPAEDKGAISPRIYQNGTVKSHSEVNLQPETIDFTLTSECNLTCSYCCKEYSSAWKKDLIDHGDYNIGEARYQMNSRDLILHNLSQNEKINSQGYQHILEEVARIPVSDTFVITGGEPLLNNQLLSIIDSQKSCNKIVLYTGLGVGLSRFKKIVNKLKLYPNIDFRISGENVGKYLEFNRYGIDANEWLEKVQIIRDSNINYSFHLTLTNLTIFGLADFYKTCLTAESKFFLTFSYQPDFMALNVLDTLSKRNLLQDLRSILSDSHYHQVEQSMQSTPTDKQRLDLQTFINRFIKHRNLDLDIYPKNFINWINQP